MGPQLAVGSRREQSGRRKILEEENFGGGKVWRYIKQAQTYLSNQLADDMVAYVGA